MISNKIAFHYDPKEIFKGYKKLFLDSGKIAYISRGNTINEERYYFAEAGAQRYFYVLYEDIGLDQFLKEIQTVISSLARPYLKLSNILFKSEAMDGEVLIHDDSSNYLCFAKNSAFFLYFFCMVSCAFLTNPQPLERQPVDLLEVSQSSNRVFWFHSWRTSENASTAGMWMNSGSAPCSQFCSVDNST